MDPKDEEVRQKLVDTALRLFAEHGRDRVSVRQIATEAGVTHGSIRYHFGTKDQLYIAALCHLGVRGPLDESAPVYSESMSPEEAEEELRRFVRRFVGFQAKVGKNQVASVGLMQAEVSRDGGPDPVFFENVIQPGHQHLKTLVKCLCPNISSDKTLEILTFNIIFQCVMIRIGRGTIMKLLGTRTLRQRDVARIADLIVSVTLGGLRALEAD